MFFYVVKFIHLLSCPNVACGPVLRLYIVTLASSLYTCLVYCFLSNSIMCGLDVEPVTYTMLKQGSNRVKQGQTGSNSLICDPPNYTPSSSLVMQTNQSTV